MYISDRGTFFKKYFSVPTQSEVNMLWKGQVKCKVIVIRKKETVSALRTGDMQVVNF